MSEMKMAMVNYVNRWAKDGSNIKASKDAGKL